MKVNKHTESGKIWMSRIWWRSLTMKIKFVFSSVLIDVLWVVNCLSHYSFNFLDSNSIAVQIWQEQLVFALLLKRLWKQFCLDYMRTDRKSLLCFDSQVDQLKWKHRYEGVINASIQSGKGLKELMKDITSF